MFEWNEYVTAGHSSHIAFFVEIFLGPTDHVEPEVSYLVRVLVRIDADVVARVHLDANHSGMNSGLEFSESPVGYVLTAWNWL
jgi:hypothetical protein